MITPFVDHPAANDSMAIAARHSTVVMDRGISPASLVCTLPRAPFRAAVPAEEDEEDTALDAAVPTPDAVETDTVFSQTAV